MVQKPLYEWLNENFLSYCGNYQKPITRELLKKAFEDFLEEIAIPWLNSEENKSLTNDELKEKY